MAVYWLLLFGLFSLLAALLISLGEPTRETTRDRLKRLVRQRQSLEGFVTRDIPGMPVSPDPESEARASRATLRQVLVGIVEKATSGRSFSQRLQTRLQRADWRWRPAEFITAQVLAACLGALAGLVLNPSLWLILAAAGGFMPTFLLSRSEKSRAKQFGQQLPDALAMIANALRSGYSFLQAMDVVSREMPNPIAREFGTVLKEARVNIPLEEALGNLVERVKSPDLDLLVTAVLIQRQVGGNLAEVLDKIGETIRERIRMQGEIRTLTTQGRISGWVVSLLPVILALAMQLISPGYMTPMFTNPVGWALIGISVVMLFIGIMIIRNMINVEV